MNDTFSGTLQSLSGCSTSPGIYTFYFWPHEAHEAQWQQLPFAAPYSRGLSFYNIESFASILGLSPRQIRAIEQERIRSIRGENIILHFDLDATGEGIPLTSVTLQEPLIITWRTPFEQYLGYGFLALAAVLAIVLLGISKKKRSAKKHS